MKKRFSAGKITAFIAPFFLLISSCHKDEINIQTSVNALILAAPNLPEPPTAYDPIEKNKKSVSASEDGVNYTCSEKTYSFARNMEEVVMFNPNAGTLYPGSLVQGKYVKDGQLNSIGSFPRTPVKLTLENYGKSVQVDNPDNASVQAAIMGMVSQPNVPTIAKIGFRQVEAHSTDQALLELGIDSKWAAGKIGATFAPSNSVTNSTVYISFVQEYYTVSINQPSQPSDFFGENVDLASLGNKVSAGNPLCYLSSVTYGRTLIAKITAKTTKESLKTSIGGAIKAVTGNLTYSKNSILENASYEVYIVGGSATDAIGAATGRMQGIVDYLNKGANFSKSSLGYPLSYTVRHASDNNVVRLGKALEYTVKDECYYNPNDYVKLSVKIDGFVIVGDCDNDIFTNTGAGEFTYSIQLRDNDNVKKLISTNTIATRNDGEYLNIDAGFYEVLVANNSSHKFLISGVLSEWDDDNKKDTPLKIPDIEFAFPFSEITSEYVTWEQTIGSGSCSATLYFTIKRL